ncbi:MAG: MFS transporter [Bacteroidota bacterium]
MKFFENQKSAFQVLAFKDYRYFTIGRFFIIFAISIQSVVVGWQVYEATKSELQLGLIGLAEAIPFILTSLFGGHVADIISRKKIVVSSNAIYFICTILLVFISYFFKSIFPLYGLMPIFSVIFLTGIARGFLAPAQSAFLAQMVPREKLMYAATVGSMNFYGANILGTAIGGLLCGYLGTYISYSIVSGFTLFGLLIMIFMVQDFHYERKQTSTSIFKNIYEGIDYVFKSEYLLTALSLDMFAVLFGGAVAILPAFADKILHVGPKEFGLLRAAPSVGIVIVLLLLAYFPPKKEAGKKLLYCVAGFGLATIAFGFSRNIYLCFFFLMLTGIFDGVSVVIRGSIVPMFSPDHMRGRIEAVNKIFIGSSNEIGSFESGFAAKLLGLVPSIIFGGGMTMLVVAITWWRAKGLRKLDLE